MRLKLMIAAGCAALLTASPAVADKIKNPVAVFSGLDKITGRIISFEASVGETVQFGALQLTPRVCYTRPPTESPNTTAFIEVDEVTLDNKYQRIFTGWVFASSPGLSAIEHSVYDIWLVDCKGGTEVIVEEREQPPEPAAPEPLRPGVPPVTPSPQLEPRAAPPPTQPRPAPPAQAPRQRFFPTNPAPGPDPARGGN